MSKHTPGPWESVETKPIAGVTVARGWFVSPVKGRRSPVLDIAQVHLTASQDREEQEANARLIAAAPDLLESLQEMVADLLSHAAYGFNDAERGMLKRAEDAIKKAGA